MFKETPTFSGFSVNNLDAAQQFYGDTLGIEVVRTEMGLELHVTGNAPIFVYEKADHQPATFTILNFVVDDIDSAIDGLADKGVNMIKYEHNEGGIPDQDAKGVLRGRSEGMGPDIAWFTDPAGNTLAVLQN